ncbi:hypothetical protein [Phosphitispora fastidiosa]|uniref:hypothetical protein n=1 Tax=Phosphitispora fastidiosa TaxID=2837202 RepID=UPI001E30ACF4|nr:hypothetical protein [Phosphitispora fastidiosa]MBU7006003.1 low affinity Fe/Cu permease [Phosphitispora fastidiosa]
MADLYSTMTARISTAGIIAGTLLLWGIFTSFITRFATGEMYIAIASTMVFTLPGIGIFLF